MEKYEFVDAQEMHKKNPKTFDAPSEDELNGIEVGDNVKVSCNNERFWIQVVSIDGDKIEGAVNNDLIQEANEELTYGTVVTVEKKNVYDIYK